MSARPGRLRASPAGSTHRYAALAFGGVRGEFGLDGAQQSDLGGDLGGEVGERDRRVAGVELERGVRGGDPFVGPVGAVVVVRCLGDQRGEPLRGPL